LGEIDPEGKGKIVQRIIFGRLKATNVQIAGQKIQKNPKSQILKKRHGRL